MSYRDGGMFRDGVPEFKTEIYAGIFNGKELIKEINTGVAAGEVGTIYLPLSFDNIPPGKYILRFGIKSKNYLVTHNSEKIDLIIK
jgi:hypothetical protein